MNAPVKTVPLTTAQIAALHAKLTEFDLYVVCDGSGSMGGAVSATSNKTRWSYMQECVQTIVHTMSTIDTDGIGVVLFNNSEIKSQDGVKEADALEFFKNVNPGGGTPLAKALDTVLNMAGGTDKKDLIVVFTDGEPDGGHKGQQAVIDRIVQQANSQDRDSDCTILFIQVGDDQDSTKFLETLDDDLVGKYGAKFDIVDCKTVEEVAQFGSIEELLANAIVD